MNKNISKHKIVFKIFDMIAVFLSYWTMFLFSKEQVIVYTIEFVVLLIGVTLVVNVFTEDYKYINIRGYLKEVKASVLYSMEVVISFLFLLVLYRKKYILDFESFSLTLLVYLFFAAWIYTYFFRVSLKVLIAKTKMYKVPVLLVTNFSSEHQLEKVLDFGYEIEGYINFEASDLEYQGKPILKNIVEIRSFLSRNRIEEIFISSSSYDKFSHVLETLKILGIPVNIDIKELSHQFVGDLTVKTIDDRLFLTSFIKIVTFRDVFLKRSMDIIGGLIGVCVMVIVGIVIYPRVQKESKGPLLFKQKRVGKNGKVFYMYKFRSMYLDAEERKKELLHQNEMNTNLMFKMKEDPRIFPFGKRLRETSLDELPQFINVLKGEMSLVGTRPPTLDEYENYELHHFKRLSVKPGITGIWQVSGRSNIEDFEKVIELDLKYIQNWSINMDIKILFRTIQVVLKKEGSM